MKELGDYSEVAHREIIEYIALLDAKCVLVGEEFGKISLPQGMKHFLNTQAVKVWFDEQDLDGLAILLKGSRSIGLEQLLD